MAELAILAAWALVRHQEEFADADYRDGGDKNGQVERGKSTNYTCTRMIRIWRLGEMVAGH